MSNRNNFWGFFCILVGILLFLSRVLHIRLFGMDKLWPMFILIPGLCFHFAYFISKTKPGILVPGGILTTIGLLFFFETLTNWHFAAYTWPIYPLSVAIGLSELYIFGGRRKSLLVPIGILCLVPALSFFSMLYGNVLRWINSSLVFPAMLILIGIALIFNRGQKNIE